MRTLHRVVAASFIGGLIGLVACGSGAASACGDYFDAIHRRERHWFALTECVEQQRRHRRVQYRRECEWCNESRSTLPVRHHFDSGGSATNPMSPTPLARMIASTFTTEPYGTRSSARR